MPAPWTEDPIIQQYKFCNAFRASDRATQHLIRNVIYRDDFSSNAEDVMLRILLFRFFNNVQTAKYLEDEIGEPRAATFDVETYGWAMDQRINGGQSVFGGAFILSGTQVFSKRDKHTNYLALIKHMMETGVTQKAVWAKSFEEVYEMLHSYPLIGNFMAYQIATDINYSEIIDFPENSFTKAGPGAERGIDKCFEDKFNATYEDVIRWMVDHQETECFRLGIDPSHLWIWGNRWPPRDAYMKKSLARPLMCIDVQNLFCETDKYLRVKMPELTSGRTRIKAQFAASKEPICNYYYPPKWHLDCTPAIEQNAP